MYFCTPTFDPYEGLAQTLQAAYASTTMRVVPETSKLSVADRSATYENDSSQALPAAA